MVHLLIDCLEPNWREEAQAMLQKSWRNVIQFLDIYNLARTTSTSWAGRAVLVFLIPHIRSPGLASDNEWVRPALTSRGFILEPSDTIEKIRLVIKSTRVRLRLVKEPIFSWVKHLAKCWLRDYRNSQVRVKFKLSSDWDLGLWTWDLGPGTWDLGPGNRE